MAMRLLSFAIWALVAASAVFWLTRLLSRSEPAPAHTVTANAGTSTAADFSRLLGSTRTASADPATPEPTVDSRFRLIGVVAPRSAASESGLALIAVDGKPPRPVGLGGVVDGSLVLLTVNHRRAELGPAGGVATVRLELPAVAEASRSARAPGAAGLATPAAPQAPATPPPPLPATPRPVPLPVQPAAPAPQPNRPLPAVTR